MRRQFTLVGILLAILIGYTFWITSLGELPGTVYFPSSVNKVLHCTVTHLELVAIAELTGIVIGVPLGILITRPRFKKLSTLVIGGANVGQTIPSLALIAIMVPIFGLSFRAGAVALIIYGLLPIVRNSYAGINNIAPAVVEAARGMGMSEGEIARKVELPLALPVIMAGIRVSTVITVGTAELAGFIGAGGLGTITLTGVVARNPLLILQGAAPTAALAVALGLILALIEKRMAPWGRAELELA